MGKSLAWRDRLISAAVGAAVASILVPAEAHAPASLGAAGQFNLFPYNTSYNRNSAHLGQSGVALSNKSLTDDPASQYVGRGSLGTMFGDRFLSASGSSHISHPSSRGVGSSISRGRGASSTTTILTQNKPGNTLAPDLSARPATPISRRVGSGNVGVTSDDSEGGLYYASASQVAAATTLGTGQANHSLSSSSGADGGPAGGSSSSGGATFTFGTSGGGGSTISPASAGGLSQSNGNSASVNTTRTVSLNSLNGSVVTTGSANQGQYAGSSIYGSTGTGNTGSNGAAASGVGGANGGGVKSEALAGNGTGSANGNTGAMSGGGGNTTNGVSLFPDTQPVSAIAPSPVPEPGIVVTALSLLSMTGFALLRGRLRRA